jgi:hypothetical protein
MLAREKKEKKVLKRRNNAVFLAFFVQSAPCANLPTTKEKEYNREAKGKTKR